MPAPKIPFELEKKAEREAGEVRVRKIPPVKVDVKANVKKNVWLDERLVRERTIYDVR
jgi:hypothetical protein